MKKQGISLFLLALFFLGSLKGYSSKQELYPESPDFAISMSGSGNIDFFQPVFEFSTTNIINLNPATDFIISENHWLVTSSFAKKPLCKEGLPSFWQENLFFLLFPYHTFL